MNILHLDYAQTPNAQQIQKERLKELDKGYIKNVRIRDLRNFYLSCGSYDLTYIRAKKMGVSNSTAKDYMDTVLAQIENYHNK